MIRRHWWVVVLGVMACSKAVADEAVGDLAAGEGRWADAHDAWQAAGHEPRVLAKRADAALNAGRLGAAAVDWTRLGERDTARTDEAAAGLARTALAAARTDDRLALAAAVRGLMQVAPGWPVGRLVLPLRLESFPAAEDILALAPAVLASAPARDVADGALLAWARADHEQGHCDTALPRYVAVELRAEDPLRHDAAVGVARCLVVSGEIALAAESLTAAAGAFNGAVRRDPSGPAGRRALIGLGDVHLRVGELFAAQLAWRTVATTGGESDSLTALALERLRASEVVDSMDLDGIP